MYLEANIFMVLHYSMGSKFFFIEGLVLVASEEVTFSSFGGGWGDIHEHCRHGQVTFGGISFVSYSRQKSFRYTGGYCVKTGNGTFFLFVCFSQDSGGPLLGSDATYLCRRIIKICLWIPPVFEHSVLNTFECNKLPT